MGRNIKFIANTIVMIVMNVDIDTVEFLKFYIYSCQARIASYRGINLKSNGPMSFISHKNDMKAFLKFRRYGSDHASKSMNFIVSIKILTIHPKSIKLFINMDKIHIKKYIKKSFIFSPNYEFNMRTLVIFTRSLCFRRFC